MNGLLSKLLCGALTVFCLSLKAQSINITGQVLDTTNAPLELANVIALKKRTKGIASYGITDNNGRFQLRLEKDSLYTLKASYLGFETYEEDFKAVANQEKILILQPSANELEGVELVEEFPVTVSGDTITYNADSFTTGKEKKLENVLEELPGFEVTDEGEVKVQGKKVEKVLVEGKEFFDGDTKMATKNIPANAVDKVQVLRDFNEITPLKGVSDSDALALNIKLKDGKKNLWFGDVSAGIGPDGRYLVHPNLFYYSPKTSFNFIGDANNIGEQAFTLQDYFRFNGGLASLGRRSGSTLRLSNDDIGLSLLQNNRAQNIETQLMALNFNHMPNKKWKFSGFGIFSDVDTDLASVSNRTYIREEGDNQETLNSNTLQTTTSTLLKLSSTYTPNTQWYLTYDGFVKGAQIQDRANLLSEFESFSNDIVSNNLRRPFSIEQNLNAFFAKDEKNVFSLESSYLYKQQRPDYDLTTTQQPFVGTIPLNSNGIFNLFQEQRIITNKIDAELNYYRVLNNTNHLNFKLGTSINGQRMRSSIAERLEDGSDIVLPVPQFGNQAQFDFWDVYLGLSYRAKLGKLTLSPGLNFHIYDTANTQFEETFELDKTLLLPQLRAKFEFNSSQSLRLDYGIQAEFADIRNLAQATLLSGYNSLIAGNPELRNAWYHNLSLNYFNFSMFNFTNINGGMSYQKRYQAITNTLRFVGLDRESTPINIDEPNETFSLFGNYERRFPYMKGRFEANVSYSKFNNAIDGQANFNRSFTQNYKLSLETRFKEAPNVEVGFEKIWNDYGTVNIDNRFVTDRPFANIEAYFVKSFALTVDYQYNAYRNRAGGVSSYYDFLNAALYFEKEDSPWEIKLSGLNLLNTASIRQDAFSENLISTYEYFVQPRYFMLSIKYSL
ncbi:carboxypeptidase-like regulatory domain-containing protein [Croceivirga thetidis]|uniref:TonB-dependent receptor n=1 Tax=Croceivirga thetidis TaxID=2721623 RepID=A0ABX1GLN1_9FLAO|nr:carboxypeptidase-like regulatory domain-containing protein [Croceivirga thetidis]NKI30524.1 TonB-dependent receptor [Croceivirga thetidis]